MPIPSIGSSMPAGSPPLRLQLREPLLDLIVAMQRLEILQRAGIVRRRTARDAGEAAGRVHRLLDPSVGPVEGALTPAHLHAIGRSNRRAPQILQPLFRFAAAGADGFQRRLEL